MWKALRSPVAIASDSNIYLPSYFGLFSMDRPFTAPFLFLSAETAQWKALNSSQRCQFPRFRFFLLYILLKVSSAMALSKNTAQGWVGCFPSFVLALFEELRTMCSSVSSDLLDAIKCFWVWLRLTDKVSLGTYSWRITALQRPISQQEASRWKFCTGVVSTQAGNPMFPSLTLWSVRL